MPPQDEAMLSSKSQAAQADWQGDEPPADAVSAAPKKREPPPESPESAWLRTLVIFSFWAIVLFLGLPIWWRTTAIYRARLPLSQMMDWADGKVVFLPSCRCRC